MLAAVLAHPSAAGLAVDTVDILFFVSAAPTHRSLLLLLLLLPPPLMPRIDLTRQLPYENPFETLSLNTPCLQVSDELVSSQLEAVVDGVSAVLRGLKLPLPGAHDGAAGSGVGVGVAVCEVLAHALELLAAEPFEAVSLQPTLVRGGCFAAAGAALALLAGDAEALTHAVKVSASVAVELSVPLLPQNLLLLCCYCYFCCCIGCCCCCCCCFALPWGSS